MNLYRIGEAKETLRRAVLASSRSCHDVARTVTPYQQSKSDSDDESPIPVDLLGRVVASGVTPDRVSTLDRLRVDNPGRGLRVTALSDTDLFPEFGHI